MSVEQNEPELPEGWEKEIIPARDMGPLKFYCLTEDHIVRGEE